MDDFGQQERAILDLLAGNPFLGQAEIAKSLGLARSTVAAHIGSLIRKGHILGRGYVLPQPKRILCAGGATVDRKYHALSPLAAGTSNPVRGYRSFGGVARNVTENLARLGVSVSLMTMVGEDENGREIVRQLRDLGVDTSQIAATAARPTAEYVAVLDPANDLALGVADMAIFDELDVGHVERAWPHLAASAWVFADCNLSAAVLAEIVRRAETAPFKLAVDTVSAPKATRLPQSLAGIAVLFINRDEAAVTLGGGSSAKPEDMARALLARGAERVVLTRGAEGCLVAGPDGVTRLPPIKSKPLDVTGAGDALISGTLYRMLGGEPLERAARTGMLLATLTVETEATVHPALSESFLDAARPRLARVSK